MNESMSSVQKTIVESPQHALESARTIPDPILHSAVGRALQELLERFSRDVIIPSSRERKIKQAEKKRHQGDVVPVAEIEGDDPWRLDFLAHGGEHVILESLHEIHHGIVVKINFAKILALLEAQASGDSGGQIRAKEDIEQVRARRAEALGHIKRIFGVAAVPPEKNFVIEVPISSNLFRALGRDVGSEMMILPETFDAPVTVQRRVEMDPERTVSLSGYYPEAQIYRDLPVRDGRRYSDLLWKTEVDERWETYKDAHNLLTGRTPTDSISRSEQRALILGIYPSFQNITSRLDSDPEFTARFQDVVRKLITYTNETKVTLDLAGSNNVVFSEGKNGWEIKCLDPLPIGNWTTTELESVVQAYLTQGKPFPGHLVAELNNELNTVRVINSLAILAGIPERLEIPGLRDIPGSRWREYFDPQNRTRTTISAQEARVENLAFRKTKAA